MISNENRTVVLAAIIVGVCLLVGLAAGGYFIGKGSTRFKSDIRTVTVKGLVEKEVKADQAVWMLRFRRASEELKDAHAKITSDREAAVAFLRNQGFKDEEISRQPTRTIDKLAREYSQSQTAERFRYVVTSSVLVTTANVDLVTKAVGTTEELLKSGVILDGQQEGGQPTPVSLSQRLTPLDPNFSQTPQRTHESPLSSLPLIPVRKLARFVLQTKAQSRFLAATETMNLPPTVRQAHRQRRYELSAPSSLNLDEWSSKMEYCQNPILVEEVMHESNTHW